MRILLLIVLLSVSFVSLAQEQAEDFTCPGSVPTRLQLGDIGYVTTGQGLNTRPQPDIDTVANGTLDFNQQFIVVEGPECADGYTWWKIFSPNDIWIVESIGGGYLVDHVEARDPVLDQVPFVTFTTHTNESVIEIHRIWLDGSSQIETYTCSERCTSIVWAENGRRYSIGAGLSVSTFDSQTGEQLWGLRSGTTVGFREAYGAGSWTSNLDFAVMPYIAISEEEATDTRSALQFWNLNQPASGTRLGLQHAQVSTPVWSPDLLRIAYVGVDNDQADIHFYDLVNRNSFPITNDPAQEIALAFSPDGNRLAYNAVEVTNTTMLTVLTLSNQNRQTLLESAFELSTPIWSADGANLAVVEASNLLVFNGAAVLPLADNVAVGTAPAWSADGTQIAYLGNNENGDLVVFVVNVRQGATPQQLGDPIVLDAPLDLVSPPQWLPQN